MQNHTDWPAFSFIIPSAWATYSQIDGYTFTPLQITIDTFQEKPLLSRWMEENRRNEAVPSEPVFQVICQSDLIILLLPSTLYVSQKLLLTDGRAPVCYGKTSEHEI
jgi:hypothetical protein